MGGQWRLHGSCRTQIVWVCCMMNEASLAVSARGTGFQPPAPHVWVLRLEAPQPPVTRQVRSAFAPMLPARARELFCPRTPPCPFSSRTFFRASVLCSFEYLIADPPPLGVTPYPPSSRQFSILFLCALPLAHRL